MSHNALAACRSVAILKINLSSLKYKHQMKKETLINHSTATDGKPLVVGSALSPKYCRDCKNYPEPKNLTYENHLKCKHCVFIGNQQSNFEPKSV